MGEFPYFTAEHEMIRQTVRRFCEREIRPHAVEWDEAGIFPRELFRKAAALGLLGMRVSSEWGGNGLDWWASAAYIEGLVYGESASVVMGLLGHTDFATPIIEELGTAEQKALFLRPAVAGESVGALGVSEPGGGSDVAALRTRARREGDEYVISGQKLWITNGTRADFIILAARTGDEGHRGVSLFTFPTDVRGFSVGKTLRKVGNLASDTGELFFDECRIPARFLLGEEQRGFYYIMHNFQGERLATALLGVAEMEKSLRDAIRYGSERTAFGKPVASFQVWQHRLVEHLTQVEAGRWLTYRALDLFNRKQPASREVTMAKLFVGELAQRVLYDCMQLHGGFGYTTEYPVGRSWRDYRVMTIAGGTSEVLKEILVKLERL